MIDWIMKRRKKNNERAISKNFQISNIKEFYVDKYVNMVWIRIKIFQNWIKSNLTYFRNNDKYYLNVIY